MATAAMHQVTMSEVVLSRLLQEQVEMDDTPTESPFRGISTLTDSQEKTLSLLSVIAAILSICGSSVIIYRIFKFRQETTPYERIMLGLSSYDIVASLTFGLAPFLAPSSTSERVWAIGSDATCSFHGFLSQLSFAAVMYNAWLAYYYLFTVRLGMKRYDFARRFEVSMHAFTFLYFISTGLGGVFVGFYGELEYVAVDIVSLLRN